ncbi:unnamed protein product [Tilletia controversa]|uniref:Small EDRK-rich factor-like N-terminal domain-containing protein n=3 Tax=Tilletia TaxID=13289 RepID=A0A8X7MVQ4_9BASI|nr:hypothetical protein CF336_g2150 [Tilletia laevis]KAE8202780.1 hypothetical protein CF328_g2025 [Tilletia controversa]KAE8263478.1 hypothetical protein A4X03_0g1650 [Tilletia caries]KAE8207058.1 hypothetical protein CF335_g1426 [Tilletia laevis]KAE8251826.1 hypothetical protein A4X06_0g2517 [Tilletia controversa]
MTRGNQREQDRLRAQKKTAGKGKSTSMSGTALAARKEADAEAVRQKIAAKEAAKAAAEAAGGTAAPKKT